MPLPKKTLAAALAVVLTGTAGVYAYAQGPREHGERGERGSEHRLELSDLDANNDGQIGADEFTARQRDLFVRLDTDANGQVSEAELEGLRDARRAQRLDERFASLDANGDGSITQAEIEQAREERRSERQAERFARADANGDGAVSREEFDQTAERMMAREHERGGPDRKGGDHERDDDDAG